ncbi:TlpA family protein disulfide reductase [Nubsella zeaxanthinifaciens]|uniref:TlpA family protein disulfide reductase n=1 Tax=Nubsella zeaxanthinifaciens TaxID=392412 RepID=UPI003CFDCE5F
MSLYQFITVRIINGKPEVNSVSQKSIPNIGPFLFAEYGDDITLVVNEEQKLVSAEGRGSEKVNAQLKMELSASFKVDTNLSIMEQLNRFRSSFFAQKSALSEFKGKISPYADSVLTAFGQNAYMRSLINYIYRKVNDGKVNVEELKNYLDKYLNGTVNLNRRYTFETAPKQYVDLIGLMLYAETGNKSYLNVTGLLDRQELLWTYYQKLKSTYLVKGRDRLIAFFFWYDIMLSMDKANLVVQRIVEDFSKISPGSHEYGIVEQQYKEKLALIANLSPGSEIPDFVNLKDYNGKKVSLKDLIGKVVYIDFWAYWCSGCRNGIQNYAPKLHERLKDRRDIVFVYISVDDNEQKWKAAIEQDKSMNLGLHWIAKGESRLMAASNPGPISKFFNIDVIARAVIIGKDGKLINGLAPLAGEEKLYQLLLNTAEGAH